MTDNGDGHLSGFRHDHWEQLSTLLNRSYATGSLKAEKLFDSDSDSMGDWDPDYDEDSEMQDQDSVPPLVLKLWIGGKSKSDGKKQRNLSRLDVLKTMFDAFVNRLLAYNFQTHMGLITFQSSPSIAQSVTHAVENFRQKVNHMRASGDTALWDALALANDQLSEYHQKYPNAKKRIICLSDGKDNKSKKRHSDVSWSLFVSSQKSACSAPPLLI